MNFMILDYTGNAVDAFETGDDARAALRDMVTADPSAVRDLTLIAFDDAGLAVGEPEIAADVIPELARSMSISGSYSFVRENVETFWALSRGVVGTVRPVVTAAEPGRAVA